jgi:MFS family permease
VRAEGAAGAFGIRSLLPTFDGRVWVLLWAMLAFRFAQGLYYPFSTVYFHNSVGLPLSLIGVGLACLALASVFSGLVAGPLADRYGRKPVMLAALAGNATAFAVFAFAGGFGGYLAACVIAGLLGAGTFDAARNAVVADVVPEGERARAYGLVRMGANVGWALGPVVAGLLVATAGTGGEVYRAMFLISSLLILLVLAAIALLVGESAPRERGSAAGPARDARGGLRAALADRRFLALLAAGFFLYYVFTQDWQALPIYATNFLDASGLQVGLFLAGNGLVVAVLQLPVAFVLDRRSKVVALAVSAGLFGASAATLLLTDSVWGVFVAFAGFFTLAEMILEVAGAALAADLAPEASRGTYLALFGCCFGAAYGLSPIIAGLLLDARLPHAIWTLQAVAAAAALLALAAFVRLSRSGRLGAKS